MTSEKKVVKKAVPKKVAKKPTAKPVKKVVAKKKPVVKKARLVPTNTLLTAMSDQYAGIKVEPEE